MKGSRHASYLARLVALWFAFALGAALGALITSHLLGKCDVRIVEVDTDALENAATAALPVSMTGSGAVSFIIDPTGIRVHTESMFENQNYDTKILAVVRGSPVTLEISSQLLRRLLSR